MQQSKLVPSIFSIVAITSSRIAITSNTIAITSSTIAVTSGTIAITSNTIASTFSAITVSYINLPWIHFLWAMCLPQENFPAYDLMSAKQRTHFVKFLRFPRPLLDWSVVIL